MSSATAVTTAAATNKKMLIYFAGLAIAGVALIVLTVLRHWGGYGYAGGIFLLAAGILSPIGMAKQGGEGVATCPACGLAGNVSAIKVHRTLQCGGCHIWLHGAETMTAVPASHVASKVSFWVALPEAPTFGDTCIACTAPATRKITIESVRGAATAMVVGVGVVTTTKVKVPACAAHDAGPQQAVDLTGDADAASKLAIGFASLPAWQRFCDANHVGPTAPARYRIDPLTTVPAARVAS